MKGERLQDQNQNNEERPFKYNPGDRTIGMEMSQSASVASAAAEFLPDGERRKSNGNMSRTYFRRPGERPAFLVLRDGLGDRSLLREEPGIYPAGPCLIRSEEWLLEPELAALYSSWMSCGDEGQAERILQRIYYRPRLPPPRFWSRRTVSGPQLLCPMRRSLPPARQDWPRCRMRSLKRCSPRWRRASGWAATAAWTCWRRTPPAQPNSQHSANSLRAWPSRPSATLTQRRAASGRSCSPRWGARRRGGNRAHRRFPGAGRRGR